jgi:hypothetical protein
VDGRSGGEDLQSKGVNWRIIIGWQTGCKLEWWWWEEDNWGGCMFVGLQGRVFEGSPETQTVNRVGLVV